MHLDTISIKAYSDLDIYRTSKEKKFDLIHTKLEVAFDWDSCHLLGEAYLHMSPLFYQQDSIHLDAKGFLIHEVSRVDDLGIKSPLNYSYQNNKLNIATNQSLQKEDSIWVYINYTARPNLLEEGGSLAIKGDKGLYFINPQGKEANKPKQIWTQGETEASSCWFPTFDQTNVKTSQEIYITVDSVYQTLSNGELLFQIDNGDGTRTDYWKQKAPHSPYLFMMAIGEYAIVKDSWRDIPVHYWVEKEFEDQARSIFPNTPQMLEFFSKLLDYPYPWEKFHQVVVRDYVSGAMENTSAVIYGEFMQGDASYLIDDNGEDVVAHELMHHWFGDLVTCESWSNLALNEAFATYGEFLWFEHFYGKDEAAYHRLIDERVYRQEARLNRKSLYRPHYLSQEDVFDAHSYQKGGLVLHMLRHELGDEAFFSSLTHYLKEHAYQNTEYHDLRQAMEKVSGRDLQVFFKQWFEQAGHPEIKVESSFDEAEQVLKVYFNQSQSGRNLPETFVLNTSLKIIHQNEKIEIVPIQIRHRNDSVILPLKTAPILVKLDAENQLLAAIDQDIPLESMGYLYQSDAPFLDRYSAIDYVKHRGDSIALKLLSDALNDKHYSIRALAVNNSKRLFFSDKKTKRKILELAQADPKSSVRAAAISAIAEHDSTLLAKDWLSISLKDSSYLVVAEALRAINKVDNPAALDHCKKLEASKSEDVLISIAEIYGLESDPKYADFFQNKLGNSSQYPKYDLLNSYGDFLMSQEKEQQKAAIPFITESIIDEEEWWVRMSGIYLLSDIQELWMEGSVQNTTEESAPISWPDEIQNAFKQLRSKEENKNLIQLLDELIE